jgi:condensin complex subunit 1
LSSDDEMEVDEEEEEEEEPEPQGDDDDTEIVDSDEPSMKDKRRKRRKSELDLDALGNEQAAVAALESTELMKLRLTKKYCAEALNFVKQIDAATTALGDLLGSKSKPEVLETIEFFRVAHEYKLQGSAVRARSSSARAIG